MTGRLPDRQTRRRKRQQLFQEFALPRRVLGQEKLPRLYHRADPGKPRFLIAFGLARDRRRDLTRFLITQALDQLLTARLIFDQQDAKNERRAESF